MDRLEPEGRSTPAQSNYGDDVGQSTSSRGIQPYLLTPKDNDDDSEYEYKEDEVIRVEISSEKNQNNGDNDENESENSSDNEGEDESRTVRPTGGIGSLRGMLGFSSLSNLGSSNPWDDAAMGISSFSRRALHEEPDKKGKNPIRTPLRALSPTKKETKEEGQKPKEYSFSNLINYISQPIYPGQDDKEASNPLKNEPPLISLSSPQQTYSYRPSYMTQQTQLPIPPLHRPILKRPPVNSTNSNNNTTTNTTPPAITLPNRNIHQSTAATTSSNPYTSTINSLQGLNFSNASGNSSNISGINKNSTQGPQNSSNTRGNSSNYNSTRNTSNSNTGRNNNPSRNNNSNRNNNSRGNNNGNNNNNNNNGSDQLLQQLLVG